MRRRPGWGGKLVSASWPAITGPVPMQAIVGTGLTPCKENLPEPPTGVKNCRNQCLSITYVDS